MFEIQNTLRSISFPRGLNVETKAVHCVWRGLSTASALLERSPRASAKIKMDYKLAYTVSIEHPLYFFFLTIFFFAAVFFFGAAFFGFLTTFFGFFATFFLATVFFLAADFAEFCFLGACVGRGVDGVAATQSR